MTRFIRNLFRTKQNLANDLDTPLLRCLNLFDLIFLCVSGMIGSGIYVLSGVVAKNSTGPAIVISNLLAACACLFGALCYAEFAARIPRGGSSYIFIYESLGELLAFLVGFSSIIGGLTGLSVSARVWSAYFDALFDNQISSFIMKYISWANAPTPFAKYPDLLAFVLTIFLILSMLVGLKNSKYLTNSLTILNMCALIFIGITGFILGQRENYQTFLPFGFQGLFRGSSLLIYSYVGFEMATIAIEEAQNPSKNVPRATLISVLLVALLYSFAESSLTYLISYDKIHTESAFAHAYSLSKWPWTRYIISIAIVFSAGGNLLSGTYGTIRIIYAMSIDGLLPSRLSFVSQTRHVPIIATCLACSIIACLSTFFDIKDLIGFTDISALLSYAGVSIGLIYERYNHENTYRVVLLQENNDEENELFALNNDENDPNIAEVANVQLNGDPLLTRVVRSMFGRCLSTLDSFLSPRKSAILLLILFILNTSFLAILIIHKYHHDSYFHFILLITCLIIDCILMLTFCLLKPKQSTQAILFQCPGFPLIPLININIFIFLMVFQDVHDWFAYICILVISLFIYFFYGYSHSKSR